ncbi:MAG: hypothetical protein ABF689_13145 [Gluconobacter cerinus]|uniref:hypothetical protein n=1 Tax=Gluconobacter cerinus TaxID=38307 RepID=UPI0039ED70B1
MKGKEIEEVKRLEEALLDMLIATPDNEILAEVKEDGLDLDAEITITRNILSLAAGKARMILAKERMQHRPANSLDIRSSVANDDIGQARRLTLAARNGTEQSENDIRSTADDLRKITEFQQAERDLDQ